MQRLLPSLIVMAGMAPMISLSLFSFVNGELWTTLTEAATLNYADYPIWRIDVALLPVLTSWTTIAIIGAGMLLSVAYRWTRLVFSTVVGVAVLAQLPGVISHTKFQWLLFAADAGPFSGQPGVVLVGLALMTTPVGIYSLAAASAFDEVGKHLTQRSADHQGIEDAQRSNFLLLLLVMVSILAIGAFAVVIPVGVSRDFTTLFAKSGPALVWISVAGSILVMAFFYSYLYSKWGPRPGIEAEALHRSSLDTASPQENGL